MKNKKNAPKWIFLSIFGLALLSIVFISLSKNEGVVMNSQSNILAPLTPEAPPIVTPPPVVTPPPPPPAPKPHPAPARPKPTPAPAVKPAVVPATTPAPVVNADNSAGPAPWNVDNSSTDPSPNPWLPALDPYVTEEQIASQYQQKDQNAIPYYQDTDHDGISDQLENIFKTSPANADSDHDGHGDAEEIFQMRTNPLDANSPGPQEKVKISITSFDEDQQIDDNQPVIKGIAKADSLVEITATNSQGEKIVIGQTRADAGNNFLLQVPASLKDGIYVFAAKRIKGKAEFQGNESPSASKMLNLQISGQQNSEQNPGEVSEEDESKPVHVTVNTSSLNVTRPQPKRLANQELTDEIMKSKVVIQDGKPVLIGVTGFGNQVVANWKSVVLTSALIADSNTGEFRVQPSKTFELGDHDVYVQAIRNKDKAMSKTVKISFKITPEDLKAAAPENNYRWWALIGVGMLIVVSGLVIGFRKKKPIA